MATEDISKKRRVRNGHRNYVKRNLSELDGLISDYDGSQRDKLRKIKRVLDEKLDVLQRLDDDILAVIPDDEDIEHEIEESSELRASIFEGLEKLESKLRETDDGSSVAGSASQAQYKTPNVSPATVSAKLPKLFMKKFSGDPKQWQQWWDSFSATIHENTSISGVDKFTYLRSLVEGTAASAIAGLHTTSANYQIAINLLQSRFAQKSLIVNAHMESLLNLGRVSSMSETRKVRDIYDKIEINIRGLEVLDITSDQYGTLLIPILMSKIPNELKLAISRNVSQEEWCLENLMNAFKSELEAYERCADSYIAIGRNPQNSQNAVGNNNRFQVSRNLPTTTSALHTSEVKPISCTYCRNAHPSVKCTIVSDQRARKEILKTQGRCFMCLRKGHVSRNCVSNIRCSECKQKHHPSICVIKLAQLTTHSSNASTPADPQSTSQSTSNSAQLTRNEGNRNQSAQSIGDVGPSVTTMLVDVKNSILLQTAKGLISKAQSPEKTIFAHLIFDSGSQRSYISERLRDALNLPTLSKETLTINAFGETIGKPTTCDVTQFCVRSPYNSLNSYVNAYVVPVVCAPLKSQPIGFAACNYRHLSGLVLADFPEENNEQLEVDVLIGSDFYWHFVTGRSIRGEQNSPIAIESILGWVLSGPLPNCFDVSSTHANFSHATHVLKVRHEFISTEISIENQVSNFWNLESLGIIDKESSVYEKFQEEIDFVDGRYQVKLPWKRDHPILPDNFQLCQKHLLGLFTKLKGDPELLKEYHSIIKDQEERKIIERVNPESLSAVGKTHYLPHHPVVRTDKETTKVRLVYDASAKDSTGVSLNQCLYPGPCLLKSVSEIITRFRLNPIALTSDIEKAFLMIAIEPSDRDVLRFLWVEDPNAETPRVIVYRFGRVVFGVTCSPFLLNATLKHHIEGFAKEIPEVCNKLIHSLYVDDANLGGHSIEEVIHLYETSKDIMAKGGFNLRKWHSNSKEVMEKINEKEAINEVPNENNNKKILSQDQSFAKASLQQSGKHSENRERKVLGLNWDSSRDMIVFKFSEMGKLATELSPTKRNVLKIIAKIFDPQGLLTPMTAQLKVFLQRLFAEKLSWDDALSNDLVIVWTALMSKLRLVNEIAIPRYYFGDIEEKPPFVELFGFCDSSETAYACIVYIKATVGGKGYVYLAASKSRVAPLSKATIPRLELLSCLILSRLMDSIVTALSPLVNVKVSKCWTDSITALYWIRGESKEWKLFVENRVQEIRKLVAPNLWAHCPGRENPADIPTRSYDPTKLKSDLLWWHGPLWLTEDSTKWPRDITISEETPRECLEEIRPLGLRKEKDTTALQLTVHENAGISRIIDSERFSNYGKLLRITAYVLRFVNACRNNTTHTEIRLTVPEIDQAEKYWIRDLQKSLSKEELAVLNQHLGSFTDENGIIRCKGRLSKSCLDAEARYPVLLPRNVHIVSLIIRHCHNKVMHNGAKETLLELRSRFWIIKGRQLVRKIVHQCVTCKRIHGQSYRAPEMSQLPEFRVQGEYAFSSVGIDFAGPLYIKSASNPSKKVYIALFTCGSTRALHLELVPNLTTNAFLLCLKRFVSRRGVPKLIVTDNAKTFKAASKKLISLIDSTNVGNYLNDRKIVWRYNLAKAPWWGGFYERLIRGVKSCLKKCVGTAYLTYDELNTIVTEIEAVMNSRPLTYLYPEEKEDPLTPAHLLMGRRLISLPELPPEDEQDRDFNESQDIFRKRRQYVTRVFQHYQRRWKREYLVELREYHAMGKKRMGVPFVSMGDIVTIEDENRKNRVCWKLGRIENIIRGQDNVVRGAVIILSNGNRIERPIQKLYPLEVNQDEPRNTRESAEEPVEEPEQERPKRQAAVIANERIRIIDQLEQDN